MKPIAVAGLAALLVLSACGRSERVVIAAGTTLVDSGVLAKLVTQYEEEHPGAELSVVGESTAQILELGRRGGADVLITHAPDLEAEFVADGLAALYRPVFESRFILAGPPGLASQLSPEVVEAFREIAERGDLFVSRSDGSGTYQKELELWTVAGVDPAGLPWYIETGQGMGLTLQVADQRGAFILSELGVFLAAAPVLSLQIVPVDDDAQLINPYQIIVVKGTPVEGAASAFAVWLSSSEGTESLLAANLELFGEVIYRPVGP